MFVVSIPVILTQEATNSYLKSLFQMQQLCKYLCTYCLPFRLLIFQLLHSFLPEK